MCLEENKLKKIVQIFNQELNNFSQEEIIDLLTKNKAKRKRNDLDSSGMEDNLVGFFAMKQDTLLIFQNYLI